MIKVGFISLGCSKNLVDTEVMLHILEENGCEIVAEDIDADVIIVNTCAFIESAKREAIDNILDVAWLKKHRKLKGIVVTGCLVERYREEVMKEMPEIDAIVGVGSIQKIYEAVESAYNKKKYVSIEDKNTCPLGGDRVLIGDGASGCLKIAEGCDNCCTYCAIPLIRGRFRSRPMEDLVEEAKKLEQSGIKELNIIAQDTTRYGLDLYGQYSLARLVREISKATNIPWIRLLYCYPDKITDDLIDEMKTNPRLLHYIDLPIQHINDKILKRMNRHGSGELIKSNIEKLRREVPDIVIRSTVIVGFPGETEEEFSELCEYVKSAGFTHLGAFTYSREEGTPAAEFEDQIDEQTKQDRYEIIMEEQYRVVEEKNNSKIGKEYDVLVEGYDVVSESYYGRSYENAPEVDGQVYFTAPAKGLNPGDFCKVRINDIIDYDLVGEIIAK
ncbi:MAG: 30S ribosomal protein S12 methylthiotransferase RimO [Clostridia bacterium]|nr:30S ribosomal protein S12 methylthiotransferase RimO [Clostridia bacterium]